MRQVVETGKTLLVDGPASVTLQTGQAEILGADFKAGSKMVIREGKRVPFEVKQKAEFEILLGEKAAANEFGSSTIPNSWKETVNSVLAQNSPATVMIVGGIDVGKTSFCSYLANEALKQKRKITLIDADLGQSDVGPPSTIGSCRITKPIKDIFETSAENICFIGVTSPSSAALKVIETIADMKEKALKRPVDILIINTDGWIEGEDAIRYKVTLIKEIQPTVLVGIQEQNELTFLLGAVTEIQRLAIESSPAVRKRDREERKVLRELAYKKYLKGATIESFPLSWIKLSGVPFGIGAPPSRERLSKIVEQLGTTPVYCEESPSSIFIALSKEQWADEEIARNIGQTLKKDVKIAWEGDEEGLIVALHDKNGDFLGIGVLDEIDYERKALKVYTPVKKGVVSISVGQIKLDKTGKELGPSDAFVDYD